RHSEARAEGTHDDGATQAAQWNRSRGGDKENHAQEASRLRGAAGAVDGSSAPMRPICGLRSCAARSRSCPMRSLRCSSRRPHLSHLDRRISRRRSPAAPLSPVVRSRRGAFHVLGGAVRIDDAVCPQRAASELHRHSDREPNDAEVEVETEELQAQDADQVTDALHVVAEVEVAHARDHGQQRSDARVLVRLRARVVPGARGGRSASRTRRSRIGEHGPAVAAQDVGSHLLSYTHPPVYPRGLLICESWISASRRKRSPSGKRFVPGSTTTCLPSGGTVAWGAIARTTTRTFSAAG